MRRSLNSILVTLPGWQGQFDMGALQRLTELDPNGVDALLARLFELYSTSLQEQLELMDSAAQREDLNSLKRAAHAIRSASVSIGALAHAEACTQLERAIGLPGDAPPARGQWHPLALDLIARCRHLASLSSAAAAAVLAG